MGIGSIFGWGSHIWSWFKPFPHVQAFGYLMWKVIAFIMLNLMVYILFEIKHVIKANIISLEQASKSCNDYSDQVLGKMQKGYKKVKNLIIFELLLSIFLLINVVYEIYVIICIYRGVVFANIYAASTV